MPEVARLTHAQRGFKPRNPSSLAPGPVPDHQVTFVLHKALLPTEGCGPKGLVSLKSGCGLRGRRGWQLETGVPCCALPWRGLPGAAPQLRPLPDRPQGLGSQGSRETSSCVPQVRTAAEAWGSAKPQAREAESGTQPRQCWKDVSPAYIVPPQQLLKRTLP